jgi:heme/copper-type cytochrome/quinol oxidase subunit 4
MTPTSKYSIGMRFGLLTGLLYVVLLFLRYNFFASNPLSFGLCAFVSYLVILMMYLFAGIARKKELGGYADFKEIFTTIFIAILIAEAVYILFNLVYLKFVDAAFWENFRTNTLVYLQKKGLTDEQIEQQMKSFKNVDEQSKPMGLLKGYGFSIIMDCIFGLIFAAILRKTKPVFEEILEEPKS